MLNEIRSKYNNDFTEEKYLSFLNDLNSALKFPCDFRVSETPLFLSNKLRDELQIACKEIIKQLQSKEFANHSINAIPNGLEVPNEDEHTTFLQIDFAITKNADGSFIPKLIELQGFPSLYAFQVYQAEKYKLHFNISDEWTTYFNGFDKNSYQKLFKDSVLGNSSPENVILLEIEPENQKTRIDFSATKELLGINYVCITKIIKRGNKLFYSSDRKETPIERIYNRVIYDEIERKNVKYNFKFTDELDVKWIGHPNWFFKISKFTLPLLKSKYVPKCFFLRELNEYPSNLENYVLKPLFSFAGLGVDVEPTIEKLNNINEKENYILQEKIEYAPLVLTPDGYSKVEIRMMIIWKDEPILVNNLVRMSKGKMMGVDFNKNKTWVGSSCAFHL